jgi:pyruvate formate lyase activating enzyme
MPLPEGLLRDLVHPSELSERIDGQRVRCLACGHRCSIAEGQVGVCKVRFVREGRLHAPWGYVAGSQADPIEKKPFFHVLPGSVAYSFGMLGCDLHCPYCQNWLTSQTLRDPEALAPLQRITPEEIVCAAVRAGAESLVSTYNEPLITVEWAVEIFRQARGAGLKTGFVSNGNATPEVLEFVRPWLDFYKVDLKSFNEAHYRRLGGRLALVLDSIRRIHEMGIWIEIVTLLVPGFNDSEEELTALTEFISSVSPEIPWHVTAFHPDYKMLEPRPTLPADLSRACDIGRRAGLRYVYAGNLPGRVAGGEDTLCPGCGATLIRRHGFRVLERRIGAEGTCAGCGRRIPGRWTRSLSGGDGRIVSRSI